jgi:dipeptidyl aminopeptidase/acylaminoacyl peptidase
MTRPRHREITVPYNQAVRLDTALRWAGVQSYFVTIKGAGHGNLVL